MRDHPGEPGGIDEDVGAPEFILHRRGGSSDLSAVLHWDAHRAMATARDLADQRRGSGRALVVTDGDARSGGREPAHGRGADTAAAAGHNRHFADKRKGVLGRHFSSPAMLAKSGLNRSAASY